MLAFIIRRILAMIPVMALVALFVFSLLYVAPGDPAAIRMRAAPRRSGACGRGRAPGPRLGRLARTKKVRAVRAVWRVAGTMTRRSAQQSAGSGWFER